VILVYYNSGLKKLALDLWENTQKGQVEIAATLCASILSWPFGHLRLAGFEFFLLSNIVHAAHLPVPTGRYVAHKALRERKPLGRRRRRAPDRHPAVEQRDEEEKQPGCLVMKILSRQGCCFCLPCGMLILR